MSWDESGKTAEGPPAPGGVVLTSVCLRRTHTRGPASSLGFSIPWLLCRLPEVSLSAAPRGQLPVCRTGAETGAPVWKSLSADRQTSCKTWDRDRLGHVPLLLWDGCSPMSLYRTVANLKGISTGHGT